MRVMVTGGTGFVGAHSVKALVEAGHDVCLLVRDPSRIRLTVGALGVADPDHVVGDITDPEAVEKALAGCDAALHCAAMVSTSRRDAERMLAVNPLGARTVVGLAVEHGLDPVVHVSSIAALFDPHRAELRSDLPVTAGQSPYGRSKAQAETYVRGLQLDGAPVVITYPGSVIGPAAGPVIGESSNGIITQLRAGMLPLHRGAWSVIDVRDVGRIHTAVMEPGRGPRRYLCGGHYLTLDDVARIHRELTGRRFPVLPLPPELLLGVGRVVDVIMQVTPLDSVFTHEAMEYLTKAMPTDDSAIRDDLGIELRDPRDTLGEAIVDLLRLGHLSARDVGLLAPH